MLLLLAAVAGQGAWAGYNPRVLQLQAECAPDVERGNDIVVEKGDRVEFIASFTDAPGDYVTVEVVVPGGNNGQDVTLEAAGVPGGTRGMFWSTSTARAPNTYRPRARMYYVRDDGTKKYSKSTAQCVVVVGRWRDDFYTGSNGKAATEGNGYSSGMPFLGAQIHAFRSRFHDGDGVDSASVAESVYTRSWQWEPQDRHPPRVKTFRYTAVCRIEYQAAGDVSGGTWIPWTYGRTAHKFIGEIWCVVTPGSTSQERVRVKGDFSKEDGSGANGSISVGVPASLSVSASFSSRESVYDERDFDRKMFEDTFSSTPSADGGEWVRKVRVEFKNDANFTQHLENNASRVSTCVYNFISNFSLNPE